MENQKRGVLTLTNVQRFGVVLLLGLRLLLMPMLLLMLLVQLQL